MAANLSKQRIPELDGLRGLAILLALVFHYITQEGAQLPGSVPAMLQRFVIMGWTGVDLFFVLSGFLIGGILMDVRGSPRYSKTFYSRRFFRIVPIYYLWILTCVGAVGFAGGPANPPFELWDSSAA
jgi:peptidoglycan/LPS O-acetylase OafA/YrhL